ncbi:HAD family hydrolase [Brevibacillus sp. SYSU BS000544]|uniref:HAD family hydrolase n=1 Tax=Brevibacillus sp. SYSU BS000544 TaxID=3416443 RepID=UPI003CE59D57
MKPTTILFDLDGTLLGMRTEEFVHSYMGEIGKFLGGREDTKLILKSILDATKAMIMSQDSHKTNEQVFEEHFLQLTGLPKEEIWPIFDRFYEEVFPSLSKLTYPSPLAKKVVDAVKEQGYKVAVATNPVFPKSAIMNRLAWIEMDASEFELVTVYEESHHTKPNLAYFQEICEKLGVSPSECIMIGNHMQEDMVASKLGMKTYLVTDYMENRGEPVYPVDQEGSLEELYQQIVNRSGLFS